jgi:hypothetical protein
LRAAIAMIALLLSVAGSAVSLPAKQLEGVSREHHPWGQFKIGSWKRVRTLTETLDEKGAVASTSTTETTTKLVDVDPEGYTLRIDVVVEVAGKRFTAQPQIVRRGFHGEAEGQNVSFKRTGAAGLTINGVKIPCEVQQITVDHENGKRITVVHYSERHAPFVLRRETTTLDNAGKPTDVQSQVDVVAFDMPHKVLAEVKPTSHVRIMHQQGKASTLTLEVHCTDVPGGVVSHTSKESDESGRVIRRSTLELLDYGIGTGDDDDDAQMVRKALFRVRNRRP